MHPEVLTSMPQQHPIAPPSFRPRPCTHCRNGKTKCVRTESSCERCRKKHLHCDFESGDSPISTTNALGLIFPSIESPVPQSPSSPTGSAAGHAPWSPIPHLPYTRAPPQNMRPRYSGGMPYPDLALRAAPQPAVGRYYPYHFPPPNVGAVAGADVPHAFTAAGPRGFGQPAPPPGLH